MKHTWLVYHDGVYVDTQWERTEEEALAAHRATWYPPEEGDHLYGNDKPVKITVKRLVDAPVAADHMESLREVVRKYPINIAHTGSKRTEHGVVDSFSIDTGQFWPRGETCQLNVIKQRSTPDFDSLEERELKFLYGPDAERQREKALRYLHHYGNYPVLPAPILTQAQATRLRDAFYESFEGFKELSQSFKQMAQTAHVVDRWEGPRRKSIRLIYDTLQTVATEQKRNSPKGPQPRKKWPLATNKRI